MKKLTNDEVEQITNESSVMYDYRITENIYIEIYLKDGDIYKVLMMKIGDGWYETEKENSLGISGDFLENESTEPIIIDECVECEHPLSKHDLDGNCTICMNDCSGFPE